MVLRTIFPLLTFLLAACGYEAPSEPTAPTAALTEISEPAATTIEESAANTSEPNQIFTALEANLQKEIDENVRAGFVTMIAKDGALIHTANLGMADREKNIAMTPTTRFRIASMTKPITTLAMMILVEEGKLSLNDPLTDFIPAFSNPKVVNDWMANEQGALPTHPAPSAITLHQLMTHTAGIGYLFDNQSDLGKLYIENSLYFMEGDLNQRIENLADLPLAAAPGQTWIYSYSTDVLGRVIEVASGQDLESFMRSKIFAPLGMEDTEFLIDETDFDRLATVYLNSEDGTLILPVRNDLGPDPNAKGAGWASGGSGLVSTAQDYMTFLQLLLNKGATNGVRIVSEETIEQMLLPQISNNQRPENWIEEGRSFGYGGWVTIEEGKAHANARIGQYGWSGYFDTAFGLSANDNLAWISLSQHQRGPHDQPSKARNLVRDAAYAFSNEQTP